MQTSRRTLAADALTDGIIRLITSRNSGIDLALIMSLGVFGILAGTVSPWFFFPLAVPVLLYLLRGYAHDKADRNAEEERYAREMLYRRLVNH